MPSSPFLRRVVPVAIVIVVVLVALVPAALTIVGQGDRAARLGGDFPSFYAAGRIIIEGEGDSLYDPALQRDYQAEFHDDPDEFLSFAYPPFVAVIYATIAWLPYGVALSVHALAALTALALACAILTRWLFPGVAWGRLVVVATAWSLAAYPVVTAVLGGQNTTFTLLAAVVAWRAASTNPAVAGIAGAACLAKPQFGIILIASLLATRAWKAAAWAGAGALAIHLATSAWWGLGWVNEWSTQVRTFGEVNDEVNGPLMVNVVGWVGNLSDSSVAALVALVAVALGSAVTGVILWRRGATPSTVGMMGAWLVLGSLSALFYDAGVALVTFGAFAVAGGAPLWVIPSVAALSWSQTLAGGLGWSPVFVLVAVIWAWQAVALVRRPEIVSHAPGTLADPAAGSGSIGGAPPWQATGSS